MIEIARLQVINTQLKLALNSSHFYRALMQTWWDIAHFCHHPATNQPLDLTWVSLTGSCQQLFWGEGKPCKRDWKHLNKLLMTCHVRWVSPLRLPDQYTFQFVNSGAKGGLGTLYRTAIVKIFDIYILQAHAALQNHLFYTQSASYCLWVSVSSTACSFWQSCWPLFLFL